jgi:hypothetical protein
MAHPFDATLCSARLYRSSLKRLGRACFRHTQYRERFTDIGMCHLRAGTGQRLRGIQLFGAPGSGKTFLAKDYCGQFKPYRDPGGQRIVPVVHVPIPSKPSRPRVIRAMLRAMGDAFWNKRRPEHIEGYLDDAIVDCRVSLIIFDEMQHVVDRANKNVPGELADFLKEFMDKHDIAIVIVGLARCDVVVTRDPQLRDRFAPRPLTLGPITSYALENAVLVPEYQILLALLDKQHGFPEVGLKEPTWANKFLRGSLAYPGRTAGIIAGAIESAVFRGKSKLEEGDFYRGFERWIQLDVNADDIEPATENPFNRPGPEDDTTLIIPADQMVAMVKDVMGLPA